MNNKTIKNMMRHTLMFQADSTGYEEYLRHIFEWK
jgi:hypothetical protein